MRGAEEPVAAVFRHLLESALLEAGSETGGTSETRGFEVRSSRFLELRTPNVELRIAPLSHVSLTRWP